MFRNCATTRCTAGREVLTADGAGRKAAGTIARAIRTRAAFGMEAAHTSWLMHEFVALERFTRPRCVPRPTIAAATTQC